MSVRLDSRWIWRQAARRLRRGWRSGELLILALALTVAVAAATAVGTFSERVRSAIAQQTGEALGADLLLRARDPLPPALLEQATALGLQSSQLVNLPTVIFHGDSSSLAGLKAADDSYPLRGRLRIADAPYAAEREQRGAPPPGEAWADPRLWSELGLQGGESVVLGAIEIRITGLLSYEPDRGAGFADLAPRLLINRADLPATQLVLPGSRAWHALMLSGPASALAAFRKIELPPNVRVQTPEEARPEIRNTLDRAEAFLDLAALAATLLAAAAIALCARQHGQRLQDEVALLRCLGAPRNAILYSMLLSLLLIGLAASLVGAVIGFAAQTVLQQLAQGLFSASLPVASLWPAFSATLMGLVLLGGFSLPPVLLARDTPPIRIFQRTASGRRQSWWLPVGCAAAVAGFLLLDAHNVKFASLTLLGILVSAGVLAALAALLIRLLHPLRSSGGSAWRLGLSNISRRQLATVAQCVALGLGMLALLLLSFVHRDLLAGWRDRLPAETPNQFLINIQTEQVEPLRAFLNARGIDSAALWPMTRGRLTALNGEAVTVDSFEDPDTRRWISREFNLSWSADMQKGNSLLEGDWWTPAEHGQPWLSADVYARERLNLKLGDRLTLDFAGHSIEFSVRNFREVEWDSFQPNFFLLAPPGAITGTATTWLTSFYLPPSQRPVLRDLIREFPNVTALDLDAMMAQVRGIMDRITGALEFVFLFTLAAGFAVLLAAIEATRDERIREVGLLRALGASRRSIAASLLTEYAVLGLLAGGVAALAAQLIGSLLADQVLDMDYGLQLELFAIGLLGGGALIAGLGWFSLRPVTNTPPYAVLRRGG